MFLPILSATKNRQKHNQHFKTAVFTINLHFVTSNQISTSKKLNLCFSQALFITSINAKTSQTDQSIPRVFSLCLKRTTHKPLKVAAAKILSCSVYVIGTTFFDECFLFYMITERHYFSIKINVTLISF